MDVWIDAGGADAALPLFRLPPLERLRRTLAKASPAPNRVIVSNADGRAAGARLREALADAPNGLLILDGGAAVDPRLVSFLLRPGPSRAAFGGEGPERTVALRLEAADRGAIPEDAASLLEIAETLSTDGVAPALSAEEMPAFIAKLRRSEPFWLFRVTDETTRRERERWLFRSNYKGSTDFLTRWVYPPVVWPLVRFSVRWGIRPNAITALSVVFAFLCVPFFAVGDWLPGLAMAYAMTILDSVDGKVARVTLTDSRIGDVMDHGLDIVHPPFWYLAWAWGLNARDVTDPLMQATVALVGIYVLDRLVLGVAKRKFGRGLHAVTPLDGEVRSWIARRNVNLAIFTVALAAGQGALGLYAVAAWSGLTLVWHGWRTFSLPADAAEASGA